MKSSNSWQINHVPARRLLLVFSLTLIIILTVSIKYTIQRRDLGDPTLTYILLLAGFASIIFAIKSSYKNFLSKKILIELAIISIPRFFFRDHKIDFKEITAIEICSMKNSRRTAFVIRKEKAAVPVNEDLFMCSEHFDEFIAQIKQNVTGPYKVNNGVGLLSTLRMHFISASVATTLAVSFFVFLENFDNISEAALQIGGLTKNSITINEFYRLFSSFFLHYNLPHLALNLIALGVFARPVELIIGRRNVINVIFLSAFFGSLFSAAFSPFELVIGASGGILGLVGAYTAIYFKCANKLAENIFITKNALIATLALQIASDIFIDGVDYFSHFFGYISGMIYAGHLIQIRSSTRIAYRHNTERVFAAFFCITYFTSLIYIFICYTTI